MTQETKVLVTGGAGFIGSHLVDRLIERGCRVLVVDDLSTGHLENVNTEAEFEEIDITGEELAAVFDEWRPDIVYHLAAQANVRVSLEQPLFDTRVNAEGTLAVLEGARAAGSRKIIFTSTGGAIYGEPETIPCGEDHPIQPLSLYGANKRVAEHYVQVYKETYGLEYSVLRFANIYGPRQSPKGEAGVVAIFSELMLKGKQPVIFGDGSKTRDYVHIDDTVEALMLVLDGGRNRIYNIGKGVQTSDQQVFDTIAAAAGYDGPPEYGDFRAGEVMHIALDATLIQQELGWKPRYDFAAGIEATMPFYRNKFGISSR
jgi:UDP-glucose 4-epimerase